MKNGHNCFKKAEALFKKVMAKADKTRKDGERKNNKFMEKMNKL